MTNQTKTNLPLYNEDPPESRLPTGKPNISFSELSVWLKCSWQHKLKYIDKIDADGPTIHTEYGQSIHSAMEWYLANRGQAIDSSVYVKDFKIRCKAILDSEQSSKMTLDEKLDLVDKMKLFSESMEKMLAYVPGWLDETFPGWEPVAAEQALYEPIIGYDGNPVYFKGFVDCLIRVPKKKKVPARVKKATDGLHLSDLEDTEPKETNETEPGEWDYIILDWKGTDWGWRAEKKREYEVLVQLHLYKVFFCTKNNIPLENVKCGFVLLKRTPDKSGSYCEYIPVSVGPKSAEKAMNTVQQMVNQVIQGRAIKNKFSCKFCKYAYTEHCT